MRKFAFYLPQFHEIPENDLWWGKGFTEWIKVKAAKPLFYGHIQPQIPLGNNYYNLLQKETVKWQTSLLKEYKLDGFIYYHYYFKGRMLLEKPAENLLKWKDIQQPFFFCWANHSWFRSWEGSKELLLKQEYGNEEDWNNHFNYLLPFFQDERYEKRNNKPLLMIFNSDFKEKNSIYQFLNQKCVENGFDGICFIETHMNLNWKENEYTKEQDYFAFLREPGYGNNLYIRGIKYSPIRIARKLKREWLITIGKTYIKIFSGEAIYRRMTKYTTTNMPVIRGAFFEWDNTPRHSTRGYIITPPKKKTFFKYMDSIKDDDYVFFNAWNEWAEGMMLEPTEHNKYKYLEWIREWSEKNS